MNMLIPSNKQILKSFVMSLSMMLILFSGIILFSTKSEASTVPGVNTFTVPSSWENDDGHISEGDFTGFVESSEEAVKALAGTNAIPSTGNVCVIYHFENNAGYYVIFHFGQVATDSSTGTRALKSQMHELVSISEIQWCYTTAPTGNTSTVVNPPTTTSTVTNDNNTTDDESSNNSNSDSEDNNNSSENDGWQEEYYEIVNNTEEKIENAQSGSTVEIDLKDNYNISNEFLEKMAKNNRIGYILLYRYRGRIYVYYIPVGAKYDMTCEWYGPFKMMTMFSYRMY